MSSAFVPDQSAKGIDRIALAAEHVFGHRDHLGIMRAGTIFHDPGMSAFAGLLAR